MAWTNIMFGFESKLTASKLNNMFNNLIAIADGDTGAPNYVAASYGSGIFAVADIAPDAAGRSEFKTTTAQQSVLVDSTTNVSPELSFTGGDYTVGFWYGSNSAFGGNHRDKGAHDGTFDSIIQFRGSGGNIFVLSRYVQASPPYNLGDGDVPLFMFYNRDNNTQQILQTSIAEDPPWFAYGPHKLGPEGNYQKYLGVWGKSQDEIIVSETLRNQVIEQGRKFNNLTQTEQSNILKAPYSQVEKNIDMPFVPHPFNGTNPTNKTFMVNPYDNTIVQDLITIHKYGANDKDSLSNLLYDNYFTVKPIDKNFNVPNSVGMVDIAWRNTKK